MKLLVSSTALTAVSRQRIVSNPKKAIRTSIGSLMFFGLLFFFFLIFTLKRDHRRWSSIYLPWRAVHHGTVPFQIPAPTSKSRTALFRLFGRMLHLAQRMLHPMDIDSSDGHKCWLVLVTGAITSQNEALGEFYGLDGCKPSTDSFKPKKGYPNLNRVSKVFWHSFFHHVNFYVKTGSPLLVFDLPYLESGSPWYCYISNHCTHF